MIRRLPYRHIMEAIEDRHKAVVAPGKRFAGAVTPLAQDAPRTHNDGGWDAFNLDQRIVARTGP